MRIEHGHVITILLLCGKALRRRRLKLVNLTRLSSSFFYPPDQYLITPDEVGVMRNAMKKMGKQNKETKSK